jgi:K+-transporting ATPase ATPase A chain
MLIGRFAPIVAVLAFAGTLAAKRVTPASVGTLRTDSPTFGVMLWGVVVVVAGLSIFPALAPGPIVEGLGH